MPLRQGLTPLASDLSTQPPQLVFAFSLTLNAFLLPSSVPTTLPSAVNMKKARITNVWVLAAISTIGGALFGFECGTGSCYGHSSAVLTL